MINANSIKKISFFIILSLFLLINYKDSLSQVQIPKATILPTDLVPLELIEQIAIHKAKERWGKVVLGHVIPCSDDDGDLIAFICPFAIGISSFPSFEEIEKEVKDARIEYKKIQDSFNGFEESINYESRDNPSSKQNTLLIQKQETKTIPGGMKFEENTVNFNEFNAKKEMLKRKMYGIEKFGTVIVSSHYNRFPIPLISHYLSPFYVNYGLAVEKAIEMLGTTSIKLERYYFLGRSRGQYFEFSSEQNKKILIEAFHLEANHQDEILTRKKQKVTPSPEIIEAINEQWKTISTIINNEK